MPLRRCCSSVTIYVSHVRARFLHDDHNTHIYWCSSICLRVCVCVCVYWSTVGYSRRRHFGRVRTCRERVTQRAQCASADSPRLWCAAVPDCQQPEATRGKRKKIPIYRESVGLLLVAARCQWLAVARVPDDAVAVASRERLRQVCNANLGVSGGPFFLLLFPHVLNFLSPA